MGEQRVHLVWDWNGTLYDDIEAVLGATNASFAEIGLEPVTLDRYRELYCVPVPAFYERLMGRRPTEAEWLVMDETFHRHYTRRRAACTLARGVEHLLARWGEEGHSQSLLSMYGHEELLPVVRSHGIERHFVRIDGRTGPSGGGKAEHMARHLTGLAAAGAVVPERTVVIGDTVDDALAARHVGAAAVLYTGGSNSRSSLAAAGVPVVDDLAEAVETARALAD